MSYTTMDKIAQDWAHCYIKHLIDCRKLDSKGALLQCLISDLEKAYDEIIKEI